MEEGIILFICVAVLFFLLFLCCGIKRNINDNEKSYIEELI